MKKILVMLLALSLVLSLAAPAMAEEPVKLSLFISADSERMNADSPMHKFIRDASGVELEYQIPIGDANEKLNMLLVGGTYPDLLKFNSVNIMNTMISEGIALPLEDLIEQYAPNVKTAFGDTYANLFSDDGHIWSLPTSYGQSEYSVDVIPTTWSGYLFNVREDIWEACGSPDIKTLDDIYDLLVKMKDVQPKNAQGVDYYPIGGFMQGWQDMLPALIQSAGGYSERYYIDDNNQLSYWVRAPWALEIVKWYNKLYREGLLDPEAFTMDRATFCTQKLGADKAKAYFGQWYFVSSQRPNLEALGVENSNFQHFTVSVPGVGQTPKLVPESSMGNGYFVVTDNLKDDETKLKAAMSLINALCDPYNNFVIVNGIEGVNWEFNAEGKPVLTERYIADINDPNKTLADAINYKESGADTYGLICKMLGQSPWGTYMALKDDPKATGDERAYIRQSRLVGYEYDTTFFETMMNRNASDDQLYIKANLDKTFSAEVYESILADSEEKCVELFNKYIADLEALGLNEMEEFWNAEYQAYIAR